MRHLKRRAATALLATAAIIATTTGCTSSSDADRELTVGFAGEHPGEAHALAHPAGELVGALPHNVLGEADGSE